jgi:ferredoxin
MLTGSKYRPISAVKRPFLGTISPAFPHKRMCTVLAKGTFLLSSDITRTVHRRKEWIMAAKVDKEKCTGCGDCVEACPLDAITVVDDTAVINDECAECGACLAACPHDALSM